jgi:hypothetical protein
LTRDYYQWLRNEFGPRFKLLRLDTVLFYKTEPAFNTIYEDLITARATTEDPVRVTFFKRVINLSAGFFGTRHSQLNARTTYKIVDRVPRNYAFYRHSADLRFSMCLGNATYFLLETKPWPRPCLRGGRSPSKNAVPLFLAIVEMGKQRMMEILRFLQQHLRPCSYLLAYSNIDNILIALSTRTLEEAVLPDRLHAYQDELDDYLKPEPDNSTYKAAGRADCQWFVRDCDWRFISLRTQHYVLSAPSQDKHKISGLAHLNSQRAFDIAEQQLQGFKVLVDQQRRLKKMAGLETRTIQFQV